MNKFLLKDEEGYLNKLLSIGENHYVDVDHEIPPVSYPAIMIYQIIFSEGYTWMECEYIYPDDFKES